MPLDDVNGLAKTISTRNWPEVIYNILVRLAPLEGIIATLKEVTHIEMYRYIYIYKFESEIVMSNFFQIFAGMTK